MTMESQVNFLFFSIFKEVPIHSTSENAAALFYSETLEFI